MKIIFGQKYWSDKNKIHVALEYTLLPNWNIVDFSFDTEYGKVKSSRNKDLLSFVYERDIPSKLYEDFKNKRLECMPFLQGYFVSILPKINTTLMEQKYQTGYLLLKPVTLRDIFNFKITFGDEEIDFYCPYPTINGAKNFLPTEYNSVVVRDFLDCLTLFLNNDFENCVRLCITCLENYFHELQMKGNFRDKLRDLCKEIDFDYGNGKTTNTDIIINNVSKLYDARNGIVHNNLKTDFSTAWIELCDKGIYSIKYIIYNHHREEKVRKYLTSLIQEFTNLKGLVKIMNLDFLSATYGNVPNEMGTENTNNTSSPTMTEEQFNDLMFQRVKISDECLQYIGI